MKEQMNLADKLKESKGITLITLVVTIIVLLILAGVSINGIMGQDGVINQAKDAKTQTNNKQEEEQISVAIAQALQKSDLSREVIEVELDGLINGEVLGEEGCCSWIVKGKSGNDYIITGNGEVTLLGSTVTAQDLNKLIGRTVEGYDVDGKEDEVGGWRVFYASEENNEVFLISKNVVPSNTAFGGMGGIPLAQSGKYTQNSSGKGYDYGENNKYSGSSVISDYGKKYNEKWFKKLKESGTTNDNAKTTAYLCDPDNWKDYKKEPATYAVGGPTKELLILSWNQAYKNGGTSAPREKATWGDNDVVENGYLFDKPDALRGTAITSDILNGLYNDGETSYWLASPARYNDYIRYMCAVNLSGYVGSLYYDATSHGVRPLVSIPISKVQIDNGEVKIVP